MSDRDMYGVEFSDVLGNRIDPTKVRPVTTTPAGVSISATAPDGTTTDITEGVQALYDLVISSMDWGSDFWTVEDAVPVVKLAEVCGFEQAEEAQRYIERNTPGPEPKVGDRWDAGGMHVKVLEVEGGRVKLGVPTLNGPDRVLYDWTVSGLRRQGKRVSEGSVE